MIDTYRAHRQLERFLVLNNMNRPTNPSVLESNSEHIGTTFYDTIDQVVEYNEGYAPNSETTD